MKFSLLLLVLVAFNSKAQVEKAIPVDPKDPNAQIIREHNQKVYQKINKEEIEATKRRKKQILDQASSSILQVLNNEVYDVEFLSGRECLQTFVEGMRWGTGNLVSLIFQGHNVKKELNPLIFSTGLILRTKSDGDLEFRCSIVDTEGERNPENQISYQTELRCFTVNHDLSIERYISPKKLTAHNEDSSNKPIRITDDSLMMR